MLMAFGTFPALHHKLVALGAVEEAVRTHIGQPEVQVCETAGVTPEAGH